MAKCQTWKCEFFENFLSYFCVFGIPWRKKAGYPCSIMLICCGLAFLPVCIAIAGQCILFSSYVLWTDSSDSFCTNAVSLKTDSWYHWCKPLSRAPDWTKQLKNMKYYCCYDHDLDLDPMTLIYELYFTVWRRINGLHTAQNKEAKRHSANITAQCQYVAIQQANAVLLYVHGKLGRMGK